ncbi:MAG: 3'-5' exonuclease domain-containing protein 2, partial [Calditrichaeota bacterium]|nr:3'-5' exonuclease domain-containing protein 2 [Calditrichota bacterium]
MNKDHIRSLERIQYEGDIEIVSDRDQLKRILDQLSRFEMIGFDTESKPVFEKGVQSRLAIIQLASHDTVYLVQVLKTGFTDGLKSFLTQDSPLKLGIGLLDDLRKLRAEIDTELNG